MIKKMFSNYQTLNADDKTQNLPRAVDSKTTKNSYFSLKPRKNKSRERELTCSEKGERRQRVRDSVEVEGTKMEEELLLLLSVDRWC